MVTVSIFNSKYVALDKIKRNTIYNGNYVFNLLSGKEYSLNKNFELITGIKATWTGGKRYVPYDIQKTVQFNKANYDWEKAYENKQSDYIRIDLKCGIRLNKPAYFLEFIMDFQNLINHRNIFMERIDPMDGTISKEYQVGFFPMGTIKIQF